MMRTYTGTLCAIMVLATLSSAGAAADKDKSLQTAVSHTPLVQADLEAAAADKIGAAHISTAQKAAHALKSRQAGLAMAALQKKDAASIPSELHAALSQASITKRFNSVRNKNLAKIRLGEKALIGTYPSPSAKNIHDSMEYLPFVLPPLGLLLLGGVTFGVVTIRKWQKIPHMPTQGRLDIKDVQASAKQMQSKV